MKKSIETRLKRITEALINENNGHKEVIPIDWGPFAELGIQGESRNFCAFCGEDWNNALLKNECPNSPNRKLSNDSIIIFPFTSNAIRVAQDTDNLVLSTENDILVFDGKEPFEVKINWIEPPYPREPNEDSNFKATENDSKQFKEEKGIPVSPNEITTGNLNLFEEIENEEMGWQILEE